jgi:hypothetical protein
MGKTRLRATDYNEIPGGRVVRWWFAPTNVTRKSKQAWGTVLVLFGAALIAMLVISLIRPDPEAAPAAASATAVPTAEQAVKSSCPAADPVQVPPEILIDTVYQTQWVRDGDMLRPYTESAGPGTKKPFPACFTRSPEGALYAAASFASGVLTATAAGDEKPFFQARASHTGNYDILIADLPDAGPAQNRPTVRFSGYRWNGYTPDLASVEIRYTLVTGPRAGTNTAITYTMTWENNDWLLVVPGKTDTVASPVDSVRTYIPWGGTS